MGINLMSACHKHKVKVFHYRNEEDKTLMPFYYKHRDCFDNGNESDKFNVETKEDQRQEEEWMETYKTDEEIQKLAKKP